MLCHRTVASHSIDDTWNRGFRANQGVWSADLGSHTNDAGNTVYDSGHCGGSMHQNENGDGDSDDTTVYQLLPSDDGDNGLSVNKRQYDRYPEGSWFKIGAGRGGCRGCSQYRQPLFRVTCRCRCRLPLPLPFGL